MIQAPLEVNSIRENRREKTYSVTDVEYMLNNRIIKEVDERNDSNISPLSSSLPNDNFLMDKFQNMKINSNNSSSIDDLMSKLDRNDIYVNRYEDLKSQLAQIDVKNLDIHPEDLIDRFCDPNNPVKISFNDISAAAYRIKGGVEFTPCTVSYLKISA